MIPPAGGGSKQNCPGRTGGIPLLSCGTENFMDLLPACHGGSGTASAGHRPCGLSIVPLTSSYIHKRAVINISVQSLIMQAVAAPVPGPLAVCTASPGEEIWMLKHISESYIAVCQCACL